MIQEFYGTALKELYDEKFAELTQETCKTLQTKKQNNKKVKGDKSN